MKDYVERLKLKKEGFLFPQLRREAQGIVVKGGAVSYSAAYEDLKKLASRLSLGKLTLHSGRIGGATAGVEAGVNKEYLRLCGGWTSSSVDDYIRPKEPGIIFSKAVLGK